MAYNGSGTFALYTPGNPVVGGTTIDSTWANNTLSDIATGLSTAIAKDGQTTTTASIPFVLGIAVTTGITTPSTTFALVNTTATTVNFAGGATTAINVGGAGNATTWTATTFTLTGNFVASGNTRLDASVFINDTSNANMTLGLTINQGANDDEILALKSSDVAHGITTFQETDTYGAIKKVSGAAGGLLITGIGLGAGIPGIFERPIVDTTNTAKTTAAVGAYNVSAALKSGTGVVSLGANGNLVTFTDNGTTRFIFDVEGSAHADVEWIAFDRHDDLMLLNGLNEEMQRRNGVQRAFGQWVAESRDILQREGIFNFYDEGPRAMMNMTRMHMLEVGAIRQLGRQQADLGEQIRSLTAENALQNKRSGCGTLLQALAARVAALEAR